LTYGVHESLNNFAKYLLIKLKIYILKIREIGDTFFMFWKALDDWDFLGGNFIIFKPKVWELLNFFELFSSLKIKFLTLKNSSDFDLHKNIFNGKKWSKIEKFENHTIKITKVLN
jgi:hypothetical protein